MILKPSGNASSDPSSRLSDAFSKLGVEQGDCLLVHSDITALLHAGLTPRQIIEQLLDAIGDEGTLILPTFHLNWCDGEGFDYRRTPSKMGLITEWARRDPRFVRTAHPIYSFVVTGKSKNEFTRYDHPSGYGVGSGFDIVRLLDGKILVIGMDWQHSMTFMHYIEERQRVSYRYYKAFAGKYRDDTGVLTNREYFLYVRDLDAGVTTYLRDAEHFFIERGIAKEHQALGTRFTLVSADCLTEKTIEQLEINPGFLHRIDALGTD